MPLKVNSGNGPAAGVEYPERRSMAKQEVMRESTDRLFRFRLQCPARKSPSPVTAGRFLLPLTLLRTLTDAPEGFGRPTHAGITEVVVCRIK